MRSSRELSPSLVHLSLTLGSSASMDSGRKWFRETSRRSYARCRTSGDDDGMGEGERERERRPAARTDSALSIAPGLLGSFGEVEEGESLLLVLFDPVGCDLAELTGLLEFVLRPLRGPSQADRREGWIGIVIKEWMTCVRGGARGFGKVGGRLANTRNSGGRILGNTVSRTWV